MIPEHPSPAISPSFELSGPLPPDVHFSLQIRSWPIADADLDPDALKVVRRLLRFGHETYFVGGCIRDLLLGRHPKDFDVATAARPQEVKKLFRNCRLIGRRFRLAHLHFRDGKIIETATFRREPNETDDLTVAHAAENLFGAAADDAIRRDFTVNALMYDVTGQRILDWTGGLADIEDRVLRAIGDPHRRIPEDPVRIIRAVKFAARLNLTIEPSLLEACRTHVALLDTCATARMVEEMFKILRSGFAVPCLEMLREVGVLSRMLPAFAAIPEGGPDPFEGLRRTDRLISDGRSLSDTLLLAALFYPLCADLVNVDGDVAKDINERLDQLAAPMQFTKRHMGTLKSIFASLKRIAGGPRTKRMKKVLHRDYAGDAIALLELMDGAPAGVIAAWKKAMRELPGRPAGAGTADRHSTATLPVDAPGPARPRRRRRRRRRPAPGAPSDSAPTDTSDQ